MTRQWGSFKVQFPDSLEVQDDRNVLSIWDQNGVALQISSHIRTSGEQPSSTKRLSARIETDERNWNKLMMNHPSADIAAAEFTDEDNIKWTHIYLSWPTLMVYATVSAPFGNDSHWAFESVQSIQQMPR